METKVRTELGAPMSTGRIRTNEDIRSLSEFRANAATLLQQIQRTRRPLVLTRHGEGAAVVLDAGVFESMLDEIELLRDLCLGEKQLREGDTMGHRAFKAETESWFD